MARKIKSLFEEHGFPLLVAVLIGFFGFISTVLLSVGAYTTTRIVDKLDETNAMTRQHQVIQQRLLVDVGTHHDGIAENKQDIKELDKCVEKNTKNIYKLQIDFNGVDK